jgi:hypothetical protein
MSALMVVQPSPPWTPPTHLGQLDPALTRLFTPRAVASGTYAVYRSPRSLADIAESLRAQDRTPASGAWTAARQEVQDAFGSAGPFDRFRLAELFTGLHPLVARGSLVREGRREAYTLISPYPDATLSTLEKGTMVIVFHLPF